MIGPEARGAWKELERHLRPYVARRVASPADVDDLLQDIFVRLHQGLQALRDEETFGGWVYRIANNVIVDKARQGARSPFAPWSESSDLHIGAPGDAGDDGLTSALGECLARFVSRLSSPYREAITLTELQGLTQKEASEVLGVSLSGMKSRVQRGRDKIRDMFEECCRISVDCRGRVVECEPRRVQEQPPSCGVAVSQDVRAAVVKVGSGAERAAATLGGEPIRESSPEHARGHGDRSIRERVLDRIGGVARGDAPCPFEAAVREAELPPAGGRRTGRETE